MTESDHTNSASHLVLGGANSGKSLFAENLCMQSGLNRIYVATSRILDLEMKTRVSRHISQRGNGWTTKEEPVELADLLQQTCRPNSIVLVDCLTMWLNNLVSDGAGLPERIEQLCKIIPALQGSVVFVSNELGMGLVPDTALGRAFRSHQGQTNQAIARVVTDVTFVAAGLPLQLKSNSIRDAQ
ncbi:MAG: bifunctional adenosylcobinamide kinase/adenosylcobinamide-phosphate guanylyltransferase [Hyphomicrobiales bacterium]|nr:MAG: bifunctional adenosylcobinamide kinase/adenosylcobinamide-phosphate guanylyltransferase [Hyphomicrobiales bacterium]